MKKNTILVVAISFLIGAGAGYFLGYDVGFEKSVRINQEAKVNCEKEALEKTRERLKSKYSEPMSEDFIKGSPYYKEYYKDC